MSDRGIKAYERKERRKMRIRNHIAHDLGTPKYRQRIRDVKPSKLREELTQRELDQEIEEELIYNEFDTEDQDYQAVREVDGSTE